MLFFSERPWGRSAETRKGLSFATLAPRPCGDIGAGEQEASRRLEAARGIAALFRRWPKAVRVTHHAATSEARPRPLDVELQASRASLAASRPAARRSSAVRAARRARDRVGRCERKRLPQGLQRRNHGSRRGGRAPCRKHGVPVLTIADPDPISTKPGPCLIASGTRGSLRSARACSARQVHGPKEGGQGALRPLEGRQRSQARAEGVPAGGPPRPDWAIVRRAAFEDLL